MKHTNYRNSVVLVKKNIDSYYSTWKKKGTGREESEMCKFSAEGKYSGDRQGDEENMVS